MKKIKYFLWLIIAGLLGILIYQNLDYFMTTRALKFDLKIASWNWTIPELQNIVYFGICFLLGLIIAGVKGFVVKFRLNKEIKTKDAAIASFKEQVNTLKTELEVFQHDPYIKKELEEKTVVELPVLKQPENDNEKGDKSDTAV
ncbi:MAG: hypothetical protein KOO65_06140 [Desulfobacterales bacterium]|nr:hypothetical protein [Desulfobacterales bacterium]